MKVRKPLGKPIIYLFFVIGIISAACFRLLIVFKYLSPHLFRPVWYIGVIGYLAFFYYRFMITEKRRHAIRDSNLIDKLKSKQELTPADRDQAIYILSSVMVSRENWNYFAIFLFSIIAIVIDLILASQI